MFKQEVGGLGTAFSQVNGGFVPSNDGTDVTIKPIIGREWMAISSLPGPHPVGNQLTNVETGGG
jgi:hypothetical protein